MKTPDKIEKGLRWCGGLGQALDGCEGGCPYWDEKYGCGIDQMHKEARAYILELEAQVPKWISVQERLPEDEEYVLCWYKDEFGDEWSTVGLKIQWGCGWDLDIDDNSGRNLTVTHWMPLPEPPKER